MIEIPTNPQGASPQRLGAGLDFTDPNSPLAPYYCRTSHIVAAAVIGMVFVLITSVPVWHTDIWGHLGFGRDIATHWRLPDRDPLCQFADDGGHTLHYSWLGQTGAYLVYHFGEIMARGDALTRTAGGAEMLRFAHASIVALRCLILLLAFRRKVNSLPVALIGLGFVLVISLGNIAVIRPQVIGELLFACVLLPLSRPVLSRRAMLALPLLLAIWANIHASFAVGLAVLGWVLLGEAIEAYREARGDLRILRSNLHLQRLALALGMSIGFISISNPWGPMIFRNVLEMSAHPNVRAMDEWQPLSFRFGPGGHLAYMATIVIPALGWILRRKAPTPTAIVLILFFATQPLLHQRTLIWWLILAPWVSLSVWSAILERAFRFPSMPSFRKTLVVGALVFLAVCWSRPAQWLLNGKPTPMEQVVSGGTPWRIARSIEGLPEFPALSDQLRTYPNGHYTGGIFASETLGDYLLWDLPREFPVFIYTHVHLFSPERWRECMTIRGANPGWEALLERDRINLIVVEAEQNPQLCDRLRQDKSWKVIADETGLASKRDQRCRLFVALRAKPLM